MFVSFGKIYPQSLKEEPLCLSPNPSSAAAVTRSVADAAKLASSMGVGSTLYSSQGSMQRVISSLGTVLMDYGAC